MTPRRAWLVPAAWSGGLLLALTAVLDAGVRHPSALGPAFASVMNLSSLARIGLMFASPMIAWPWARARGATWRGALLASLAAPVAYAVAAAVLGLSFYPPGEALYYATNPLTLAALCSTLGLCAGMEVAWRWWRGRRDEQAPAPRYWMLALTALGAFGAWAIVIWDSGVHWFYVWMSGYEALFT